MHVATAEDSGCLQEEVDRQGRQGKRQALLAQNHRQWLSSKKCLHASLGWEYTIGGVGLGGQTVFLFCLPGDAKNLEVCSCFSQWEAANWKIILTFF